MATDEKFVFQTSTPVRGNRSKRRQDTGQLPPQHRDTSPQQQRLVLSVLLVVKL